MREVRKLAEEEGTSVNQFVNVAVAEKVATLRTARYFEERAARADVPGAISSFVASVPASRLCPATSSRVRSRRVTSSAPADGERVDRAAWLRGLFSPLGGTSGWLGIEPDGLRKV